MLWNIQAGADPNERDSDGDICVALAAGKSKSAEILKLFFEHGVKIDADSEVLKAFLWKADAAGVEFLLSHGVGPTFSSEPDFCPFQHVSFEKGEVKWSRIRALLTEYGAVEADDDSGSEEQP